MSDAFGVASMAGTLRRVGMRRPGAILTADAERWHYAAPIDATVLQPPDGAWRRLLEAPSRGRIAGDPLSGWRGRTRAELGIPGDRLVIGDDAGPRWWSPVGRRWSR